MRTQKLGTWERLDEVTRERPSQESGQKKWNLGKVFSLESHSTLGDMSLMDPRVSLYLSRKGC